MSLSQPTHPTGHTAAVTAAELRVVVVMPAYNAAATTASTVQLIPALVDEVVLVDDASGDDTVVVARKLGLTVVCHTTNVGYGGNQKTCYRTAMQRGADIVVMLHPDGQYDPSVIPALVQPIRDGRADMVLASRMLTPGGAKAGGMPWWKRLANRALTRVENAALGSSLSEAHTGYRAYSRAFLETVPWERNHDDFVFDTEIIFQARAFGQRVLEVPVQTTYASTASSVNLRQSVVYGTKTLVVVARYLAHRRGRACALFSP